MLLDHLSDQEIAILQATKASESAMTVEELARNAETSVGNAQKTLDLLVAKKILQPDYQEWDGTIHYYFPWDSDYAQAVYDEIYGPLAQ